MRLLDLFCGAGGAAMGYSRAGFTDIVGVDIKPQPRYPFTFVEADAMTYPLDGFDAIHASPPCQGYSIMTNNLPWFGHVLKGYPLLILPTRIRLDASGMPYVIENVGGARFGSAVLRKRGLEDHGMKAAWLCGGMFGLPFYRHRYFESNWFWPQPGHPKHRAVIGGQKTNQARRGETFVHPNPVNSRWRQFHDGQGVRLRSGYESVEIAMPTLRNGAQKEGAAIGHAAGWRMAAEAMGIDWMKRDELTESIPPAYTEYIGRQLLATMVTG